MTRETSLRCRTENPLAARSERTTQRRKGRSSVDLGLHVPKVQDRGGTRRGTTLQYRTGPRRSFTGTPDPGAGSKLFEHVFPLSLPSFREGPDLTSVTQGPVKTTSS